MARKRGWHFLDEKLRAHSGSEDAWRVGEVREMDGPVALCERGYHASARPLDALNFCFVAQPRLCRVALSGEIVVGDDKMVATRRRLLWALTVKQTERVLHGFACRVAEDALNAERKAGREPDERSWAAIEAKRRWLRGEISDKELAAAWAAAGAAAWDAAGAAAWDAAWDAARAAARAKYNRWLDSMIREARKV